MARARLNQYDHEHYNRLVHQASMPLLASSENGAVPTLELGGSTWLVQATVTSRPMVKSASRSLDYQVVFRCVSGGLPQASVTLDLEFSQWSERNYVLLPGAAYNGNRFQSRCIAYSPKLYFAEDIGPDTPPIISDVPRLNLGAGPSRIQERSGSLCRPAMGFYSPSLSLACWILTLQGNALGDYGLSVEETRRRDRATFSITSPLVRELHNYRNCDLQFPSLDTPRDFQAGDKVAIRFRLRIFPAPRLQALFDQFAAIRKELFPASAPKAVLPFSACFALLEEKFNRENFVPQHGYYSVGPRTNFLQDWQIGWTGGMISTYPLLFAGGDATRRNVLRAFDWLFPNGLSPSGFFWDCGRNGTEWLGGDIRKPHTGNWHLIRKSGDGVFYILKQFRLMEKLNLPAKAAWREGTRRVCDAFVSLWKQNHQFGQFVDALTGKIIVGGSTSGAIIPAALALAADYYSNPRYLATACEAAEAFYRNFSCRGLSYGGPGDALQNPDSESWYALVESYVQLYDSTGDRRWLERAAETSRQLATWVVAYDYAFPSHSLLGRAGIRSTGAVYANTQNKHAAPGFCTYSGLALLKLFRATGDRFHLDLLRDIAFHLPQYLPHPLKPLGDAVFGRICERINLTDWEGPERVGETLYLSTWAETSLMLTTIEIPGLYVQPDTALVVAFDNVEAKIVANRPGQLVVALTNPTPAPARVTILAEPSTGVKRPWPLQALLGCRVVQLQPGERQEVRFEKPKDGVARAPTAPRAKTEWDWP